MPTKEELNRGFRLGEWEVLPARGVLRRGEQEERPEPKVLSVLLALAQADGDLVSKDELIDQVWDGRAMPDGPILRTITRCRKHLDDDVKDPRYIQTLHRRGYRLLQAVQLFDPDEPETALDSGQPGGSRSQMRIIAATLAALGLLATLVWIIDGHGSVHSMGVLPFKNSSGDPADGYLIYGFKEEIVQTLRNIPDFAVKNSRIRYDDEEPKEIAAILDVDSILVGTVLRSGNTLKVFYDVADGRTGHSISTGSVTGALNEFFGLQEQLAEIVRHDLFGPSPQVLVSTSRPANFGAYDRYMRGLYALERRKRGQDTSLDHAIELLQDTIRLDQEFGPAYLLLATAYALLPDYIDAPLEEMHRLAIETVEQGIEVDDSIREAGEAVFGFVFHKQKKWKQAEQAYIRATGADLVDSNAFNWYSRMLSSVGRLDAALEQVRLAQEMDPTSAIINSRLALAYTYLDDRPQAYEFFERSAKLGAGGTSHDFGHALLLARDGRLDESREQSKAAAEDAGVTSNWIGPFFAAVADPAMTSAGINAVETAVAEGEMNSQVEFIAYGMLGNVDGAMRIARRLQGPGEEFEMDLLFIPEMQPLREHPEFLDLMDSLGVSQYWQDNGCTWTNAAVQCPNN